VKFRPNTDTHDYDVKMRNVTRFLEAGDKVKVTLRFRGREMAHQNLGRDLLERVAADVEGLGKVENMPKMEGRQMVMMIGPRNRVGHTPTGERHGHRGCAFFLRARKAAARQPFSRSRSRSGRPGSLASSTGRGTDRRGGATDPPRGPLRPWPEREDDAAQLRPPVGALGRWIIVALASAGSGGSKGTCPCPWARIWRQSCDSLVITSRGGTIRAVYPAAPTARPSSP
jgi:hypothetical protein